MDEEITEKYKKSGKINSSVRKKALELIRPGMKILEIAEFIENEIIKMGGKPAFPVNISINDVAAHYTPVFNDIIVIKEKDLIKIDIGVHIDGYISDSAFTYCSEKNQLITCAKDAVKSGIEIIKSGVSIAEITDAIENKVKEKNLGLIVNLTGHTLDKFVGHGSPSIPNCGPRINHVFKEGDVIAIEPFVTENNSYVKDSGIKEIYNFLIYKPVRLPEARKILEMAEKEYNSLPFAKRWLYKNFSPIKISLALRQLEAVGALQSHPVLRGPEKKPIAQHEHTIIISDPPIVITE